MDWNHFVSERIQNEFKFVWAIRRFINKIIHNL